MPKMKSRRAVAKRFTETGTGKIKSTHDGKGHILAIGTLLQRQETVVQVTK